jgi:hypothetical protein
MGKQMIDRIKKTTGILLAILFVVSLTAASAGATASVTNIPTLSSFGISSIPSGIGSGSIPSGIGSGSIPSGIGIHSSSSDTDLNNIWSVIGLNDIFAGTDFDISNLN